MILGIVKGTVVATRKMPELVGYKFLLVEPVFGSKKDTIVAGDNIGAGVGEMVLVTTDETTQHGLDHPCKFCRREGLPPGGIVRLKQ